MYPAQTKGKSHGEQNNDLMEEVLSRPNMLKALKRVEQNRGAPGIDNLTVENLRPYLCQNWLSIRKQLRKGEYKPQPVLRVEIPKPDGEKRLLGIPTVIDRLIQQALLQILTEIFDPDFSPFSFGFRPNHRAHDAVMKAKQYLKEGQWVVDLDVESLGQNIIRLLQNEKERKQIAENGYNYIKQFTWDRTVIQLEKIFQNKFKGATNERYNLSRWFGKPAQPFN